MTSIDRRLFLHLFGASGAALMAPAFAQAQGAKDTVSIAWTSDAGTWDPNEIFSSDQQSLYKAVFDQPLTQGPDLELLPNIFTEWELDDEAMSLRFVMRDDVTFSDGSRMTAEDVQYTFHDRVADGQQLDLAGSFGIVDRIEIASPTEGTMYFTTPMPTAPQWLAFQGSFIVSKAHALKVGAGELKNQPMGSGPYLVSEYVRNSRIVLTRRDDYWGEMPAMRQVTFEIIPDPSARIAALQAGLVDIAAEISIRDAKRLSEGSGDLTAVLNPISRIIFLTVRQDGPFADKRVRLAAHHAINKAALSRAFYGGAAVPLSATDIPGMPGYPEDFDFDYDPDAAIALLAEAGFSPENPVTIPLATTNGQFPGDFDMARAIGQMWAKVGIKAEIEQITVGQWIDMNVSGKLPAASLYLWDNGTGDPELFAGYLFNADLPFATYRTDEVTEKVKPLFAEPDYDKRIAGYVALNRWLIEEGAAIPLLQAIQTLGYSRRVAFPPYGNGWLLPETITPA